MSYGIIRAKFVKQYESTRYNFQFCKSVKILYSGCKETLQSLFHAITVFPLAIEAIPSNTSSASSFRSPNFTAS